MYVYGCLPLGVLAAVAAKKTTPYSLQSRAPQWPILARPAWGIRGGATSREDGYSFSLTTFSPRGSLGQIEYAMNSVLEGALSVAVTYDTGIAMASIRKTQSPLVRDVGTRKISRVADGVAILYAGLAADSRVLIRTAQECSLGYQGKFGNGAVLPVITLVSHVALLMQEYTHMAGVRPFGASLLIASVQNEETRRHNSHGHSEPVQARLYRLEPSGSYSAWKACAIGKGSAEAEAILEEEFTESMDRNRALQLVLSVALRCSPNDGIREDDIALAFVERGAIETVEKLNSTSTL